MLTRQKVLLALLEEAGHPLTRTMLVKLAFLMRRETSLAADRTFYDFVPYRFGPFSFALYREMTALEAQGYIATPDDESVTLQQATEVERRRLIACLPRQLRRQITFKVEQYGREAQADLIKDIYARYPWYATRSELLPPQESLPVAQIAVYTLGYEGMSIDGFMSNLLGEGIRAIVDVRANPVSRKYGFARSSLKRIAERLELDYHHLPELGISTTERRQSLTTEELRQALLVQYAEQMTAREDALMAAVELLRAKPSVLVCMEREVERCHRGQLARSVAERTGLPVVHLQKARSACGATEDTHLRQDVSNPLC